MSPLSVIESCLYASDLDAVEQFYTRLLGLEVISRVPDRHVFFRTGNGILLVFNPERTSRAASGVKDDSVPPHGATGAGHLAFRIEETAFDEWRQRLMDEGVEIESQVTWPGGGRSLYFRDPADNSLELVTPKTWGMEAD